MQNTIGNEDNINVRQRMTGADFGRGFVCLLIAAGMIALDKLPLIGSGPEGIKMSITEWIAFKGAAAVSYIWRAVAAVLLCVAASTIIRYIISKINSKDNSRRETILNMLFSAVSYVFVIVGFILILVAFNVDVVGIGATIGILTIVLGFGAQELIADVFAGMCLMFENQFNKKDIIVVDDFRGEVVQIGFRTTTVRDIGDNIKIFNNSDLRNIINCSMRSSLAVCDVGVGYNSDIEQVENVVNDAITRLKNERPDVFNNIEYWGVESLSDYAIILRIVGETTEGNIYFARRLINKELLKAFKANGIIIPTVDVQDHNGNE